MSLAGNASHANVKIVHLRYGNIIIVPLPEPASQKVRPLLASADRSKLQVCRWDVI